MNTFAIELSTVGEDIYLEAASSRSFKNFKFKSRIVSVEVNIESIISELIMILFPPCRAFSRRGFIYKSTTSLQVHSCHHKIRVHVNKFFLAVSVV
jgi:hypothetical protein